MGLAIKNLNDYLPLLYEKFPEIPKSDIKKICSYGWKQVYLYNSYGGDVLIMDNGFWCYFGTIKKNLLKHFEYYIQKLTLKLRILYRRKKMSWDGYYYFALTNDLYEDYLKLLNKRGRKKKWFTFKNVMLYQLYEECKIGEHNNRYIFRIKYPCIIKFKLFKKELKTDKAELIEERNPLKFTDVMVNYNDYNIICKRK